MRSRTAPSVTWLFLGGLREVFRGSGLKRARASAGVSAPCPRLSPKDKGRSSLCPAVLEKENAHGAWPSGCSGRAPQTSLLLPGRRPQSEARAPAGRAGRGSGSVPCSVPAAPLGGGEGLGVRGISGKSPGPPLEGSVLLPTSTWRCPEMLCGGGADCRRRGGGGGMSGCCSVPRSVRRSTPPW